MVRIAILSDAWILKTWDEVLPNKNIAWLKRAFSQGSFQEVFGEVEAWNPDLIYYRWMYAENGEINVKNIQKMRDKTKVPIVTEFNWMEKEIENENEFPMNYMIL